MVIKCESRNDLLYRLSDMSSVISWKSQPKIMLTRVHSSDNYILFAQECSIWIRCCFERTSLNGEFWTAFDSWQANTNCRIFWTLSWTIKYFLIMLFLTPKPCQNSRYETAHRSRSLYLISLKSTFSKLFTERRDTHIVNDAILKKRV